MARAPTKRAPAESAPAEPAAQGPTESELDQQYAELAEELVGDGKDLDEWMRKTGYRTAVLPQIHEPPPPTKLADMDSKSLGRLFDEFGEWQDYLVREEALVANELARMRQLARYTRGFLAEHRLQGPAARKKELALVHPDYVRVEALRCRWQEKHRIVEARLASVENAIRRISRHITLRDPSAEAWARMQSVGGRRTSRYDDDDGGGGIHDGRRQWGGAGLGPPPRPVTSETDDDN